VNLKNRLTALEVLAKPKLGKPVRFFRFDDSPEQAAEIAELEKQGEYFVVFTRAIDTDQP
jgi:hypothetical protein